MADPASLLIFSGFGADAGLSLGATASSIAGAAAPFAGAAGLATSALGSIASGREASESAKYNSQVQANNATIAKQNATFAGAEGAENAAASEQKTRAEVGGIKAAQAANNIDVNTGSAVDVRSSAAELGELNAITIRSNAARQAYGYQTQAASDTAESQLEKQEAGYDEAAGGVKAATTLLGGAAGGYQSGLWNGFLSSGAL